MKYNKVALSKEDIDEICRMQQTFSEMYNADGDGVLDISSDCVQMKEVIGYAKMLGIPYTISLRGVSEFPYEITFWYKGINFHAIYTEEEILEFVDANELPTL